MSSTRYWINYFRVVGRFFFHSLDVIYDVTGHAISGSAHSPPRMCVAISIHPTSERVMPVQLFRVTLYTALSSCCVLDVREMTATGDGIWRVEDCGYIFLRTQIHSNLSRSLNCNWQRIFALRLGKKPHCRGSVCSGFTKSKVWLGSCSLQTQKIGVHLFGFGSCVPFGSMLLLIYEFDEPDKNPSSSRVLFCSTSARFPSLTCRRKSTKYPELILLFDLMLPIVDTAIHNVRYACNVQWN